MVFIFPTNHQLNISQKYEFFLTLIVQLDLNMALGVIPKKKNSIFKDIVQKGGREVNPISKKWKEMNFWQKLEREGSQNILSKIEALYLVWFITQSAPTKGLSAFLSVPLTLRK